VVLLHVIETLDLPFEELEEFYHKLEDKAMDALLEMAAPLREAGVDSDPNVRYGDPAEEIVGFANEAGTDLVVLTSHRIDLESPGAGWTTGLGLGAILHRDHELQAGPDLVDGANLDVNQAVP
jgi:nucleotide-binding universal stress UspA family protein